MALYLLGLVLWLSGVGPPKTSAAMRRDLLRMQRHPERSDDGLSTATIVLLLAALTIAWIGIGRLSPVPDLSEYPTSAYRWSMFVMSPVVAGLTSSLKCNTG